MKKISVGKYEDDIDGITVLLAKVKTPYTNQKGFKSNHVGWGYMLGCDNNGSLAPAFSSRKAARAAAAREIKRRKLQQATAVNI